MLADPDVALTDFGLALECGLFTCLLARRRARGPALRRWWLLFFASVGLASFAGGLVHGFFDDPASPRGAALWLLTLLAIGGAALAGWGIGAWLLLSPAAARLVSAAAGLGFALYVSVVLLYSRSFLVAIAHYLPATAFLFVALAVAYGRARARPPLLGLVGLLLTVVAAGVQQGGIALHPVYLDHNALYHVIQAVALLLLFRAAAWTVSADARR